MSDHQHHGNIESSSEYETSKTESIEEFDSTTNATSNDNDICEDENAMRTTLEEIGIEVIVRDKKIIEQRKY